MYGVKLVANKVNTFDNTKSIFDFVINTTKDETLALECFKTAAKMVVGDHRMVHGESRTAVMICYDEATTYIDTAGNIFTINPSMLKNNEVTPVSRAIKIMGEAITKKMPTSLLLYNNGIWRLTVQLNKDCNRILYKASFIYKNGTHGSAEISLLDYNNGENTAVACALKIPKDIESRAVALHRGLIRYNNKTGATKKKKAPSKAKQVPKKYIKDSTEPKKSYKDYMYDLHMKSLLNKDTLKIAAFDSRDKFIKALKECDDFNASCKRIIYDTAVNLLQVTGASESKWISKENLDIKGLQYKLLKAYGCYIVSIGKSQKISNEIAGTVIKHKAYKAINGFDQDRFEDKFTCNDIVYFTLDYDMVPISEVLLLKFLSEQESEKYKTLKKVDIHNRTNEAFQEIERYKVIVSIRLAKKLVKHYSKYSDYESEYCRRYGGLITSFV